ncbi:MAG TPA: Gfo/Idh/MocA family oxidoreductase [Thermoguttaceae bacterium]|nr:Gfo/Idh/MocA family oxidoreductase [Thermoguttaceae bacterium]
MKATNVRTSRDSCSRRRFLATSAAGAAIGTLALARGAHAAGSDRIKVGVIGCGGRGSGAAVNAMNAGEDVQVVALADVFDDKVQASRKNLQTAKPDQAAIDDDHCFAGFDAGEKVIASGVDVVLIACASKFHPTYMKAAVDAGKHVFLEKPHAIDPPGIHVVQEACDVAEKKKLSVVSGLCWRYDAGVQETMKRVLDGAIGEIVAIQETYMRAPYRLIEPQPGQSELESQFRNWYHFRWLSGDDVPQSLLHSMDKGQWALREMTPLKAFGSGGRSSSFGPVFGDVFDHGAIVYEYENGVRMYANVRAQTACYSEVTDTILGTKGRAYLPTKNRIEGETEWKYDGPKSNMYDAEHKVLFDAIRSGEPVNNGPYMVHSTMVAILGQMVCYTGKQMTWDEVMSSTWQAGPETCSWDMDPPVKPDADGTYPVPVPGVTKLA